VSATVGEGRRRLLAAPVFVIDRAPLTAMTISHIIIRIDRSLACRAEGPVDPLMTEPAAVNQTGKRYRCEACGTEVICVKAGEGHVACHGQPMDVLAPKPLPSTD
jgi:hypothetical protein